jgi:hypothetical protein
MYCVSAVRTGPLHLSELQHKRTLCNSHTTLSDGKVVLYLTSNRTVTYNFLRLRLDIAILARCNGRVGNDNCYRLTGTCQSIQEVIEFRRRSDECIKLHCAVRCSDKLNRSRSANRIPRADRTLIVNRDATKSSEHFISCSFVSLCGSLCLSPGDSRTLCRPYLRSLCIRVIENAFHSLSPQFI